MSKQTEELIGLIALVAIIILALAFGIPFITTHLILIACIVAIIILGFVYYFKRISINNWFWDMTHRTPDLPIPNSPSDIDKPKPHQKRKRTKQP